MTVAKWYGKIGYSETVEVKPGVEQERITERNHYGDVTRNKRMLQSADQLNDNLNIANEFSIIADPYAKNHFHSMKYLEFMGTRWKISTVDASQYPRLILTVGGVYNG